MTPAYCRHLRRYRFEWGMRTFIRKRRLFATMALALLVGILYFPTLRWLAHEWWSNDYYTHGPLVLMIAGALLWRRRRAFWYRVPENRGLVGVGIGLAAHLIGSAWRAPYISALSLPILTAGLVTYFMGMPALRMVAFPLAFAWFAVPLPFVEQASVPLQALTAAASTTLARLWGIPAQVQGAQITLASCSLQVGAPCSGLRSIVALLTLDVLFVYLVDGPAWARGVLLAMAIPMALIANIVRVALLLVIAQSWGAEAGLHYFHDYSSPVLFLVAVLLLMGVSWAVQCRGIRSDI